MFEKTKKILVILLVLAIIGGIISLALPLPANAKHIISSCVMALCGLVPWVVLGHIKKQEQYQEDKLWKKVFVHILIAFFTFLAFGMAIWQFFHKRI